MPSAGFLLGVVMITLDKRLSAVAALVRPGSRLADIGTDHAYLPVHLVQAGVCPSAIASDIGAGPLEAARHTVTENGLSSEIALRLGDGLATVKSVEVEDIAIAGMGGETIAAILEAAPWVKNSRLRLILQPMTRAEDLRRWLLQNGFSVMEEHLIVDGRHLYPVLAAEYTAAPVCNDDLLIYGGFFEENEGRPYRRMMGEHLARKAIGFAHSGDTETADKLKKLSEQLKEC
ncbi:MAG: SAM-dependent methyltransferase [Ruminococcaceae bacterium]|nr:SAM-dependent methyltransferase [Oscillospiraceae bacterium]